VEKDMRKEIEIGAVAVDICYYGAVKYNNSD